ncbi:MAG: hypothetical protein QXN75_02695 [Thermoproteota archaeon]|nr:hypothetical protein [Candidatus Brockarchaeota archaeon]
MEYEKLESWNDFNLALSLRASFSLPLFENPEPNAFVKIYGHSLGAVFKTDEENTYYRGCSLKEALVFSGAWFNPLENARKLSRRKASYIYKFWEVFPGLSIAINPWDLRAMFYSIFLSKNTRYHVNTIRWLHDMAASSMCEEKLSSLDPRLFGRSYQLAQLSEIKQSLNKVLNDITSGFRLIGSRKVFSRMKSSFLSLPYIGSKSVYAFGLFCLGLTFLAPTDRHLISITKSAGIVEEDARMPEKRLCLKYDCFSIYNCPLFKVCVTAMLMRNFGTMAGWLQTATYLYGALYLSRKLDPINLLRK